jgi:hypothetical protein
MKKLTLIAGIGMVTGLMAFVSNLSAQITIDYTDLPYAGLKVITEKDSTGLTVTPGNASSTAQAWDFSSLVKQKAATIVFMLPSATKYASAFPSANLADSTYGGNGYNFFDTSAISFAAEGAEEIVVAGGNNFQIELNLNPTFIQSGLPGTYGDIVPQGLATGMEQFSVTFSLVVTGERFYDSISYNDTVDAWGTMKMPNGATYQVLRQRHSETDYQDVYLDELSNWTFYERIVTNKNEYNWYTKGAGYILTEMDMSQNWDTIHDVIWDTSAPMPPLAINTISLKNNVNVYPNPANDQVNFITAVKGDNYISICDITGREMERVAVKNGDAILNTSAFTNGIYFYSLTDASGNLLDRGKFIIQH